jgi:hypothetical protein
VRLVEILAAPILAAAFVACLLAPRRSLQTAREVVGFLILHALLIAHEITMIRSGKTKRRVRRPIRSEKRDVKRQAQDYASALAGRELSWKSARKLLTRLEREGRALMSGGSGESE